MEGNEVSTQCWTRNEVVPGSAVAGAVPTAVLGHRGRGGLDKKGVSSAAIDADDGGLTVNMMIVVEM